MKTKSLSQAVAEKSYPDFADWWPMGGEFLAFMSRAIGAQWRTATENQGNLAIVQQDLATYVDLVYHRDARPTLVVDFIEGRSLSAIQSGEFDALSYAFYKSAFESFSATLHEDALIAHARHRFTQRVGQAFYNQVHDHLGLVLPQQLQSTGDFVDLQKAIGHVGNFLQDQGYLRDHFAFHFDVTLQHGANPIVQRADAVVPRLTQGQVAYALYEMGYPVILPSAVYLYQTQGEAQHHSSRTIEELFGRVGCAASETSDFDPTGYPSDLVVELWEIRQL